MIFYNKADMEWNDKQTGPPQKKKGGTKMVENYLRT